MSGASIKSARSMNSPSAHSGIRNIVMLFEPEAVYKKIFQKFEPRQKVCAGGPAFSTSPHRLHFAYRNAVTNRSDNEFWIKEPIVRIKFEDLCGTTSEKLGRSIHVPVRRRKECPEDGEPDAPLYLPPRRLITHRTHGLANLISFCFHFAVQSHDILRICLTIRMCPPDGRPACFLESRQYPAAVLLILPKIESCDARIACLQFFHHFSRAITGAIVDN